MTKLNRNKVTSNFDDEDELASQCSSQVWEEQVQVKQKIKVRLNTDIKVPEYYTALLNRLDGLTEEDEVELILDTVGGSLDGCLALADAIQKTPATVTGIVTGRCYSAGSLLLMYCDDFQIGPYSRLMIHNFSGGWIGKGNEIQVDYEFNSKFIRDFFYESYIGFLDEDELECVYRGEDIWLNASDTVDRLVSRMELLQDIAEVKKLEEEEDTEGELPELYNRRKEDQVEKEVVDTQAEVIQEESKRKSKKTSEQ